MSTPTKADPGLYDYLPWDSRPKITWPGNARVALWIAPNIEFYEYAPPANPHRKAWPRPLPDILGYGTRDYGNRVGHQRMMRVLDQYGLRGSVSLSTALLQHHPEVIAMAAERNWEFFSHGIYNTRYTYGLDQAQEREMIQLSMDLIKQHTGQHCDGYLAPALSHSPDTIDLFAECGGNYTCDLFHDDQPTPVITRSGKKFVSVPYSLELNDTIVYVTNKIEPRRYGQMIKDAFDRLYAEGEHSGTVMCVPLHAYQVSHPHRLAAFQDAMDYICSHDGVWKATGREIAQHYLDNHYDAALAAQAAVRAEEAV
ncbi:polysaccharide deacetylase [Stenotrophomonas ginsengisoli]|uniref:Polysaccharide deacetylase n=1 Tax=Stenotrophomonas ginsengisoli TaxID=336566 RepID=A0A0R0DB63_9GAMM|nr:polysaccharide deacetylase family protein [Stenotrophomonas ginsengisoli]KRG79612.1 polysaccharide deacetylase [Stenotrophomonas ginsengisoli]